MRPSLALNAYRGAIRTIALRHRVTNVRVFGSVLHGDDTDASDLDLLVEPTSETTLMDIAKIQLELSQIAAGGRRRAHPQRPAGQVSQSGGCGGAGSMTKGDILRIQDYLGHIVAACLFEGSESLDVGCEPSGDDVHFFDGIAVKPVTRLSPSDLQD